MTHYFAPGPVPVKETIEIGYSHRSKTFSQLYMATVAMLEDWTKREVVLIQGSASAAIESVLDGLGLQHKKVLVVNTGAFAQRVVDRLNRTGFPVVETHSIVEAEVLIRTDPRDSRKYDTVYMVQFETSNSSLNDTKSLGEVCYDRGVRFIVDAVSAFPYYPLPDADVVILSSSKQLRGLPVLGIVAYNRYMEKEFEGTGNYLDLKKAIEDGKRGQTPHTSLIPQVQSLWNSLSNKTWKTCVNNIGGNAETTIEELEDALIGERVAPVLTFQTKDAEKVVSHLSAQGLEVYYNPAYSGHRIQVSCFNYGHVGPYEELNEALLGLREDGLL